ncbi:hypothetical protein TNCV_2858131 [Trichonephila clavipes]|nr:hypothetical protein TNCV_2858131 [Trichonephila clavipes]
MNDATFESDATANMLATNMVASCVLQICATTLVTLAELCKGQPFDLSWHHLRGARAIKRRQTHLTQQPKPSDTLDAAKQSRQSHLTDATATTHPLAIASVSNNINSFQEKIRLFISLYRIGGSMRIEKK